MEGIFARLFQFFSVGGCSAGLQWWLLTPYRAQLTDGCLGALALHLFERLSLSLSVSPSSSISSSSSSSSSSPVSSVPPLSDDECDWLVDASPAELKLPNFPSFPDGFELRGPAIPQLLPGVGSIQARLPRRVYPVRMHTHEEAKMHTSWWQPRGRGSSP
jgi:hypothetical protein